MDFERLNIQIKTLVQITVMVKTNLFHFYLTLDEKY
jgi:hypothetical protein